MNLVRGSRIRDARLNAGMSQAQLARAVDTSEKNVGRWEREENEPRIANVASIARATGKDIDFFLTGSAEADDAEEDAPLSREEMDVYLALHERAIRSRDRARTTA